MTPSSSPRQVLVSREESPRLDRWLQSVFPEHSRSMLQRLVRENRVRLRGAPCAPKTPVHAGDAVEIEFPPPEPMALEPQDMDLDILFEDSDLVVVNKPSGMVVHPGAGCAAHTLVHALLHHCRGQLSGIGGAARPGIVHRLDKDTSGCIVAAKTDEAHRRLVESFQLRSVEKFYLALAWGHPRMLSGRIDAPIGRHPVHRSRMSVLREGRAARTDWKVLEQFDRAALLQCQIHTGRTHQIRVHLASLGHPVVGDMTYGRSKERGLKPRTERQMLHAWKLAFQHPRRATMLHCEAPIPADLRRAADEFRSESARA